MKRFLQSVLPASIRHLLGKGASAIATPFEVERAEEIFYLNYLREGMTVFDIGANVGEMTLLFSRFIGQGKVHAFEPSKECFDRLTTICAAAGRKNVTLNQCAMAEQPGLLDLHVYDHEHLGWNSLKKRPLENYGIEIKGPIAEKVRARTVDDYCLEQSIKQIDLLKIDVEGAEYQVLLGARRMLKEKSIRCLTFEFGQTTFDMGNDPLEIEKYLDGMGYHLLNMVANDPIFPGRTSVATAAFSMHVARPR